MKMKIKVQLKTFSQADVWEYFTMFLIRNKSMAIITIYIITLLLTLYII